MLSSVIKFCRETLEQMAMYIAAAVESKKCSVSAPQARCVRFNSGEYAGQTLTALQFQVFRADGSTEVKLYDAYNPTVLLPTGADDWEYVDDEDCVCQEAGCVPDELTITAANFGTPNVRFTVDVEGGTSFDVTFEDEGGSQQVVSQSGGNATFNLSPKGVGDTEEFVITVEYDGGDGVTRAQQLRYAFTIGQQTEQIDFDLTCEDCETGLAEIGIDSDLATGFRVVLNSLSSGVQDTVFVVTNNLNGQSVTLNAVGDGGTFDLSLDAVVGDLVNFTITGDFSLNNGAFRRVGYTWGVNNVVVGGNLNTVNPLTLSCAGY